MADSKPTLFLIYQNEKALLRHTGKQVKRTSNNSLFDFVGPKDPGALPVFSYPTLEQLSLSWLWGRLGFQQGILALESCNF